MSWHSCSETCSGDPILQRVFYKVQDYLSTRDAGDRFTHSDFRGLRAPEESVRDVLQVLVDHGALALVQTSFCPNAGCGSELEDRFGDLVCAECDRGSVAGDPTPGSVYVLTIRPARSDDKRAESTKGKRAIVLLDSNHVVYGERDEEHVYMPEEHADQIPNLLVRDGASVLRLLDCRFEPEYGNQRRRFAYRYVIHTEGDFMQQNVTIAGDGNSIGDITQQKHGWNYTSERIEQVATLFSALKTAADSSGADQRLIELLDKAIEHKKDKKTVFSALNQLVGWAADYSAVIGPFVPQIMILLAGATAG